MHIRKDYQAWILLLALSLIWGSSFILIKKGLVFLTPGQVGALRILAAAVILFPFAIKRIGRINRNNVFYLLVVGFAGSLIPSFLFAIAQTRISSSITGVINTLTPLFTILIGMILYKSRPGMMVFAGMFLAFIGTTILLWSGTDRNVTLNYYALFVILATICYGLNLNLIKHQLHGISSLAITSLSLGMVGPAAAIYLFGYTSFVDLLINDSEAISATFYIIVLGVMGTAVALVMFNKLVQITEPLFASSVTYIIPLVAVSWGFLDGEQLGWLHLIGMMAIMSGVFLANRRK